MKKVKPIIISSWLFRWMMNLYPPYWFSRTKVTYIAPDFKEIRVKVKRSLLNKNLAGTMFGGTIFSAADPFYALMYWQVFARMYQERIQVWVKHAEIHYRRPASTDLHYHFKITDDDILQAHQALEETGKYIDRHEIIAANPQGEVCVIVYVDTYLGKYKPAN